MGMGLLSPDKSDIFQLLSKLVLVCLQQLQAVGRISNKCAQNYSQNAHMEMSEISFNVFPSGLRIARWVKPRVLIHGGDITDQANPKLSHNKQLYLSQGSSFTKMATFSN